MKILTNILFVMNIPILFVSLLFAFLSGMAGDTQGNHLNNIIFIFLSWILPFLIGSLLVYSRKLYKMQNYRKSALIQLVLFGYYFFHIFILIKLG